jgi:hypothetical protein
MRTVDFAECEMGEVFATDLLQIWNDDSLNPTGLEDA